MKIKFIILFTFLYFILILIIYAGWADTKNSDGTVAKIFNGLTTLSSYPVIVLRDFFKVKLNPYILTINYIGVSLILATITEKIREKYSK